MTSENYELLTRIQSYITDHFRNHVNPVFVFHNLLHTQQVVAACEEMAEYYKIPDEDRLALIIAAWFHDSGYSRGYAKGHESESMKIATEFLKQNKVPDYIIEKANSCIEATRIPQSPTSLIGNIICDADLFHLGTEDFFLKSKLLRQELNNTHDEKINKKDWRKINISFLESHHYFTEYAKQKHDASKQHYLEVLKGKLEKMEEKDKETEKDKTKEKEQKKSAEKTKNETAPEEKINAESGKEEKDIVVADAEQGQKKKKEKDPKDRNERGISTMFRVMSNNQANLSSMADSKANIMISVNSIILSIMLSGLLTVISGQPHLAIPFFMLVAVCLLAIIFSILATRPKVTSGRFSKDDIYNKKVNLLFFGNFFNMTLKDYEWGMKELLQDRDYLYDTMIKDIYFLGIVLAKKYKFLRYSYNIFMYGLILVMIAFAVAIMFFQPEMSTLG